MQASTSGVLAIPTTQEMYERYMRKPPSAPRSAQARRVYDPGRSIYLSEAGGCARQTTLRLLKYPAEQPSQATRNAWNRGLVMEAYLTLLWAAWYPRQIRRQAEVHTPYGNGKIDVLLASQSRAHIVEIKSTEVRRLQYLPDQKYIDQLLMYLHFYDCITVPGEPDNNGARWVTPFGPGDPRPTGELTYAVTDSEKNTVEVRSYVVHYEQQAERVAFLLDWLGRVQKAVWARTPLPVPDDKKADAIPCKWGEGSYCAYYAHCWQERV